MDFKNKLQQEITIPINLGFSKKVYGKLGPKTKVNQNKQLRNNMFNQPKKSSKNMKMLDK